MKILKSYIFSLAILGSYTNLAMANDIKCGGGVDIESGATCVKNKILGSNNAKTVKEFISTHEGGKHFKGNFDECTTTEQKNSFFKEESFINGMGTAALKFKNCAKYNNMSYPDTIICYIKLGPDGCYRGKPGKKTNDMAVVIGETSGNVVTIFPNNPS